MQARIVDSPIGQLQLVAESGYVTELNWPVCHRAVALPSGNNDDVLSMAANELGQFFLGSRRAFTTPINAQGTDFQLRVWKELLTIKWGKTRTYKDVAMLVGLPKGARAVGAAIGRNPIPIFIPCHRVLGSSGALTGFSGGLSIKKALLLQENTQPPLS